MASPHIHRLSIRHDQQAQMQSLMSTLPVLISCRDGPVETGAALGAMLLAACAIFFINLTASGYANEFYSAAAQAGSVSWKAFLWGSLDSGNAITVDKPPAALWLMALSVRIFGLNSFAILLPEALMGVATTYLLYATVRRYWGNWAGIVTGFIFIITPVAALMFRFNNPDALLVLLMTGATHALLRSLEYANHPSGNRKRTWWMVLAGALIGFGFLTKQLQVLLVPAWLCPGFSSSLTNRHGSSHPGFTGCHWFHDRRRRLVGAADGHRASQRQTLYRWLPAKFFP